MVGHARPRCCARRRTRHRTRCRTGPERHRGADRADRRGPERRARRPGGHGAGRTGGPDFGAAGRDRGAPGIGRRRRGCRGAAHATGAAARRDRRVAGDGARPRGRRDKRFPPVRDRGRAAERRPAFRHEHAGDVGRNRRLPGASRCARRADRRAREAGHRGPVRARRFGGPGTRRRPVSPGARHGCALSQRHDHAGGARGRRSRDWTPGGDPRAECGPRHHEPCGAGGVLRRDGRDRAVPRAGRCRHDRAHGGTAARRGAGPPGRTVGHGRLARGNRRPCGVPREGWRHRRRAGCALRPGGCGGGRRGALDGTGAHAARRGGRAGRHRADAR
jgi:hypothetical protein